MSLLNSKEKQLIDEIWQKLDEKLKRTAVKSYGKLPYTSVDGEHNDDRIYITKWTNGFWPGLMWLMYSATGDECYKRTAMHGEELLDEAFSYPDKLDHDVGFVWQLASGAPYKLSGDENSKKRLLWAANSLMGRFYPKGQFIKAWNGEDKKGYAIIDCMMNLPLLYLASEITEDSRFKDVAIMHADKTLANHLTKDGSAHHIVNYNPDNGEVVSFEKGQGYAENSAWSRGQSWALYGFTLSFIHTGFERYLDAAKRSAHYFISNVSVDGWLPKVDFKAPGKTIDTTAGAAAASGLIELSGCVSDEEKPLYLKAAVNILKALYNTYCNWDESEDSILMNGVERYKPDSEVITKPIIYGDYYLAEAIYKLKGFKPLFR